MAVSDIRQTVLEIVNEVERKLSLNLSATLTTTDFTQVLLRLLNDVVADCADSGEWKELYFETEVTAVSSVSDYAVSPDDLLVHHLYEIAFEGQIAPLYGASVSDLNLWKRLNSFGVPRQFAVISVNASADPVFRVYPAPGASQAGKVFEVTGYIKPPIYDTTDAATVPPFPASVLIMGLHARALLEENGGEPSREYLVTMQEYEKLKGQAISRYTSDTGHTMRILPGRGRR